MRVPLSAGRHAPPVVTFLSDTIDPHLSPLPQGEEAIKCWPFVSNRNRHYEPGSNQHYRRSGTVISGVSNGESVVATFFLIRYQSVVASRREINFARQLCRISFFISPLEQ